jgi:hypothetical protein
MNSAKSPVRFPRFPEINNHASQRNPIQTTTSSLISMRFMALCGIEMRFHHDFIHEHHKQIKHNSHADFFTSDQQKQE